MVTYIDIHTHNSIDSKNKVLYNLNLNESPQKGFYSFGLHPWDLHKNESANHLNKLHYYCNHGLISAVGEIGIDRVIEYAVDKQIEMFEVQHAIAEKYKLPIIIHCVKAWSDLIGIRTRLKTKIPWVFHGFNGNAKIAQQLITRGCYISFGYHLINNMSIQEVFKSLPLENIFLETDNSDEKIETIYQKAADLRHICVQDLKIQLNKNFEKVFDIK